MASSSVSTDAARKPVEMLALFSLRRRTIIVTGAVGGLGTQVVTAILQSGGDVIAVDRDETPAAAAWAALEAVAAAHAARLAYHACDISDPARTHAVFERACAAPAARHPLRGLVNCAGLGITWPALDVPFDEARRVLDVNLLGSLAVAQAAARVVHKQQAAAADSPGASFVLVSSMGGHIANRASPGSVYAASKAGVHQLTRCLASEWGAVARISQGLPEIRVNSVSPGIILTPMTSALLASGGDAATACVAAWEQDSMLKRLSEPDEYRGVVVFLLSDASSYVTGADMRVDGGSTSW